jgi:hypothetical protein
MRHHKILIAFLTTVLFFFEGCSISYTLNGASIDYTKVKTITIRDFPNQAPLVYPPLSQNFTEGLKDKYIRQTRLQIVPDNGDLHIEGEITGYDLMQMAVKEDAYASETQLTITIRVRYRNQSSPEDDFEQTFSANRPFKNDRMLQDVQDGLCEEIVAEIADQIYNATVANW